MRFHIVALPHTQVTKEYAGCAFTEKVRRFVMMMKAQGHTVYLYERHLPYCLGGILKY